MRNSQYLVAFFAALAAAAPAPAPDRVARQLDGFSIPSLSLPTGGFSIPTISIPTDGLSGFSNNPSGLTIPTDLPDSGSGLGSGLDQDSDIVIPTPTGFPTGIPLTGLPIPTEVPVPTGLPVPTGVASPGGYNIKAEGKMQYPNRRQLDVSGLLGGSSSVQNGLENACQPVTLIFARGTTEVSNMGSIIGPSLASDTAKALSNKVNVQGVDYAADAAGIASEALGGSSGAGTKSMLADINAAISKCPNTQIVLSGYSQGAMLVHNAMGSLNTAAAGKVKAAVTFGDPFVGTMPKNLAEGAFKSFCATADPVCAVGGGTSPSAGGTTSQSAASHLGYGSDAQTAATFIKGKVTV